MPKLYEYTEAQAEAMSAGNAVKVLAEQKKETEGGYGEAWDRELYGYALEYDEDSGEPKKDAQGNYVVASRGYDVPEAPTLWRHWSKIYPQDKMMQLEVGEALSLHPKVKEILKKKVADTIGKFKSDASPETKAKYESANEAAKSKILNAWLSSKGHSTMDAGRRRKSRKGKQSRRRTARKH